MSSKSPGSNNPPGPGKRRFRVALSFPGERRAFVEEVAEHLAKSLDRSQILYDAWYRAEFARPNLDVYLQQLYHDEADLIVPFLCADYQLKEWCGLEWRAIKDVIKKRRDDDIMPMRFDRTEIPGLFSTDGYVDLVGIDAREAAADILKRLELHTNLHP